MMRPARLTYAFRLENLFTKARKVFKDLAAAVTTDQAVGEGVDPLFPQLLQLFQTLVVVQVVFHKNF